MRKCYWWLNTESKLNIYLFRLRRSGLGYSRWCTNPSWWWSLSFFLQSVRHCQCWYCGGNFGFCFFRVTWRPLLVCCGMIATLQDPTLPTKCRPSLLSGKRRGTEHYSLRNADHSNDFYDFGGSPRNRCDTDFQSPANVLTNAKNMQMVVWENVKEKRKSGCVLQLDLLTNSLTNRSLAKCYDVLAASPLTFAAVMVAKKGFYVLIKKIQKKTIGTRSASMEFHTADELSWSLEVASPRRLCCSKHLCVLVYIHYAFTERTNWASGLSLYT